MVGDVVGFRHADVGDTTVVTSSDDVQQVGDAGKPRSRLSHELRETDGVKTIAQLHVDGRVVRSRAVGVTAHQYVTRQFAIKPTGGQSRHRLVNSPKCLMEN